MPEPLLIDEAETREFRNSLVRALRKELFGPMPTDPESDQHHVLDVSPLQLYGAGILFPQRLPTEHLEGQSAEQPEDTDLIDDETPSETEAPPEADTAGGRAASATAADNGLEDQPLNLANQYSPSALGITFRTVGAKSLHVGVTFGTYTRETRQEPHPRAGQTRADGTQFPETREAQSYPRAPRTVAIQIPLNFGKERTKDFPIDDTDDALKLHMTLRAKEDDEAVLTLMLVNHNSSTSTSYADVHGTFFQAHLSVRDTDGGMIFSHIDRPTAVGSDAELASLDLLYRHRRSFCLGHGCAGDWRRGLDVEKAGLTDEVHTSSLPTYEVQPVEPRQQAYREGLSLDLSMSALAGDERGEDGSHASDDIHNILSDLCADYEAWIADREREASTLAGREGEAADSHLTACKGCLMRMRRGVEILADQEDALPLLAFRIANRAMLMQQVHSGLPERELGSDYPEIAADYDGDGERARRWRPFQLAFILMNIAGVVDDTHDDRKVVDLIWFPTGGGKTEAYLGLAAFVMALRRLREPSNAGTTVLMRYTLRLLTTQQFQRATALTLCLDHLRRTRYLGADLGSEPISIGLWVGRSLSPNRRQDARQKLKQLRQNSRAENPFQVLACPWCKCDLTAQESLGYLETRVSDGSQRTVSFRCPDNSCLWGRQDIYLPVFVIDEDIYETPPTLVLGTVDKFAQVAWEERTGRLFGIGTDYDPPELIIQDELHLISGPLGTIVGLYEMVIERLCSAHDKSPKIVASTATIRNAEDQCRALYDRPTFVFPPQGLKAGDSYFAFENPDAPGRLYAGVFASGLKSHATAQVRVCSALLQAAMPLPPAKSGEDIEEIEPDAYFKTSDPYGTLVWYFNSMRELGHATTMCTGDIPEYLKSLCRRLGIPWQYRRRIRDYVELTSRRTADEIPDILRQLERPWVPRPSRRPPVDILLATNMISVGVDVSRLGLMVVTGQPKTTSEYIQATSRVGRRHPGLVVTTYNQGKSRDRSHYEQFIAYHQSFYRFVEATSLTPFSPPARERGLRGVLVAIARLMVGLSTPAEIKGKRERIEEELDLLLERIRDIDPGEVGDAERELKLALDDWESILPDEFGWMAGAPKTRTLAYPYGSHPDPQLQDRAWPLLTSMRNVDGTAEARVISRYETADK